MDPISQYHAAVTAMLQKIVDTQREAIGKAARRCAAAVAEDRFLYVIGTGGHSYIASEEIFWRAGGLACVYPILDPGFSVSHGAWRSMLLERTPGYVIPVLRYHGIGKDDVLIVCNAYGINAATIDAAVEARRLGATVIGVTSTEFATKVPLDHPARHPSRQNLHEIADIFLNTWMPYGDAVVEIPGCPQKVAPTSSLGTAFVLHWLSAATVEELVRRGVTPPVWRSGNLPGGDEANQQHMEKYLRRVKFL